MDMTKLKAAVEALEAGAYLFIGEEEYLKRHYMDRLVALNITDEAYAVFDLSIFDGAAVSVAAVAEAVKAAPLFSWRKLVLWKHADIEKMKEGEREALLSLLADCKQYPEALLVISTTPEGFDGGFLPSRPSKQYKDFAAHAAVVSFPKSTETQLLSWLKKHFDAHGIGVDAPTLRTLLQRVGDSMDVLHSEVEKLCALAGARGLGAVGSSEVEEVCPLTIREEAFALKDAVYEQNKAAALLALRQSREEGMLPVMVLGSLSRIYAELLAAAALTDSGVSSEGVENAMKAYKVSGYRLKLLLRAAVRIGTAKLSAAGGALSEVDMASKTGGPGGWSALERFVALYV